MDIDNWLSLFTGKLIQMLRKWRTLRSEPLAGSFLFCNKGLFISIGILPVVTQPTRFGDAYLHDTLRCHYRWPKTAILPMPGYLWAVAAVN